MADMKEKLVELLLHFPGYIIGTEGLAGFLIANGVILDNQVSSSRWISVKDRLPEEEGWYLVYTTPNREHKSINKAMFCIVCARGNVESYWRFAGGYWANVTHWMHLPQPPKGE